MHFLRPSNHKNFHNLLIPLVLVSFLKFVLGLRKIKRELKMTRTNTVHQITILLFAILFSITSLPLTKLSATDFGCDDIRVIFARGSGEPFEGENFQVFKTNLTTTTKQYAPKLKLSYHDLNYPASGVNNFAETITTAITAGEAFAFNDSVKAGQSALRSMISKTLASCPATKFILAGYSQGAMVISKTLPDLNSSQIIYVATFGDPKLYLPEGLGPDPAACHGRNFSNYRQTVPDCHTATGILTALKNYQPQGYKDKLGAWCNAGDFMCGSYFDFWGGLMKAHTDYSKNDAYQEAAQAIIASIKKYFPNDVSTQISPRYSTHDTAILIDETISMQSAIGTYRREALKLANRAIANGDRVALYTFGDLKQRSAHQLCNFTTDLVTFESALESIRPTGGDDPDESALSALLYVMNTLKWQKGANKSIILLTDASYHSPDLDGTTLPQVVQRSLEIDPVNVYVITESYATKWHQSLATATGGTVFSRDKIESAIEQILSRPRLKLNLDFYTGQVNQPIEFSITSNNDIAKYQWDLDGDGQFEFTTTASTITHSYQQPFSGYIQIKAVANSGYFSTAAAPVRIFDSTSATIKSFNLSISGNSAQLSYTTEHAATTMVLVNEVPFGLNQTQTLSLKDLVGPTRVKLIPISRSGQAGKAKTVLINPEGFMPTSPRTGAR